MNKALIIAIATFIILSGCISQKGRFDVELTIEAPENVSGSVINTSSEVLMSRLKGYGISEKSVTCEIQGNKILLVMSGVDNPERIRNLLTASGKLEFWATYENEEVISYLAEVNDYLKTISSDVVAEEKPAEGDASGDQSLLEKLNGDIDTISDITSDEKFKSQNPLFGILKPNMDMEGQCIKGSVVGFADVEDTARVNKYLSLKEVNALLPRDIKFLWSRNPLRYSDPAVLYELHAIKADSFSGNALLNESVIVSAKATSGSAGSDANVMLSMNAEGADIWSMVTRESIDRCIAIVIDGSVLSSPRVMQEIKGGESQISGSFSPEEATDLAIALSSGVLPVELKIALEKITEAK